MVIGNPKRGSYIILACIKKENYVLHHFILSTVVLGKNQNLRLKKMVTGNPMGNESGSR